MAGEKGKQSINGKDVGSQTHSQQAILAQSAQRSGAYQEKVYTVASTTPGIKLSTTTPDAPNDGSNLFSNFKNASQVVIRTDKDIDVRYNALTEDRIRVKVLEGGIIEENVLEVSEIFIDTLSDNTVVRVGLR